MKDLAKSYENLAKGFFMEKMSLYGLVIRLTLISFLIILGMHAQACSCSGGGVDSDFSVGQMLPDTDGDGIPDDEDDDIDGDGVLNEDDCAEKVATTYPGAEDQPDDSFVDTNCDGVDGDKENAVWVSVDEGDDGDEGTFSEPVKTLAKAIELAAVLEDDERAVYVVTGTYDEDIVLSDDVNLYGGFSLLEDDERTRDLTTNRATLNGKDGDQTVSVEFHDGAVLLEYTLLLEDTSSLVDGFEIIGDAAGINVIALNSTATFTNNDLYDDEPTVPRSITITFAALIDNHTTKDHAVLLQNNRVFMLGSGGVSGGDKYSNAGILAYPAKDAEQSLTLTIKNNTIDSTGMTNEALAIVAADDDDDPTDDASSDSKADIYLHVEDNVISMTGLYEAAYGVLAGSNQLGSFRGPDLDNLNFLKSLTLLNNKIYQELSGSEAVVAVSVALVRDIVTIANNTFHIEGTVSIVFPLFNFLAQTELLNNTFAVDVTSNQVYGPNFWATDTMPGATHYKNKSPGRIVNNIFSIKVLTTSPSCFIATLVEDVETSDDAYVNASSPSEVKNNDIYFDTTCSDVHYYIDVDSTTTETSITSLLDLNAKTGFRTDDPTVISDNLAVDPVFTDPAEQDLTLGVTSPCIDSGFTVTDVLDDLVGTLRPQGDAYDIGAFEWAN